MFRQLFIKTIELKTLDGQENMKEIRDSAFRDKRLCDRRDIRRERERRNE